jgi:hypothetical protein
MVSPVSVFVLYALVFKLQAFSPELGCFQLRPPLSLQHALAYAIACAWCPSQPFPSSSSVFHHSLGRCRFICSLLSRILVLLPMYLYCRTRIHLYYSLSRSLSRMHYV